MSSDEPVREEGQPPFKLFRCIQCGFSIPRRIHTHSVHHHGATWAQDLAAAGAILQRMATCVGAHIRGEHPLAEADADDGAWRRRTLQSQ